jgi:glucose/arabinose dehydrogenase
MKTEVLAAVLAAGSLLASAAQAASPPTVTGAAVSAGLDEMEGTSTTAQPAPADGTPLTVTVKDGDKPPAVLILPTGVRMRITADRSTGGPNGQTYSGKAQFAAKLASGARIRIDAEELRVESGAEAARQPLQPPPL